MPGKRFERGSEEAQMMIDFINLVQDHYIVEKEQDFMDKYMGEMEKFVRKYKGVNEHLSQRLGLAMLDYIEEEQRKM